MKQTLGIDAFFFAISSVDQNRFPVVQSWNFIYLKRDLGVFSHSPDLFPFAGITDDAVIRLIVEIGDGNDLYTIAVEIPQPADVF